ncbi:MULTISPECIES: hypothetical protein [Peribacillus]|uniref:Uncharacterized protein n=1 Tax=Peribacillus simplex TaxID=1478 RepID=A0A120GNV7_9BACI|nr:hypothetical protein [Peribacillus simplex]KWW16542.1 hypothetical protein AS888_24245 [Peribacillus simplex]
MKRMADAAKRGGPVGIRANAVEIFIYQSSPKGMSTPPIGFKAHSVGVYRALCQRNSIDEKLNLNQA